MATTITGRYLLAHEVAFILSRALGLSRCWHHQIMMWTRRRDSAGVCGSETRLIAAAYMGRQPLYSASEIGDFIRTVLSKFPGEFAPCPTGARLGRDYSVPAIDLRPTLGISGARVRKASLVTKRP